MVGREMNERIEKLISQSFTDEQGERFDAEKFAELIVKECAQVADRAWNDAGTYPGNLIREHFGVER
jgi:hypothetical protein